MSQRQDKCVESHADQKEEERQTWGGDGDSDAKTILRQTWKR